MMCVRVIRVVWLLRGWAGQHRRRARVFARMRQREYLCGIGRRLGLFRDAATGLDRNGLGVLVYGQSEGCREDGGLRH